MWEKIKPRKEQQGAHSTQELCDQHYRQAQQQEYECEQRCRVTHKE